MKLILEKNGQTRNIESISEHDLNVIYDLNPSTFPYVILENDNGDYLQCFAGDKGFVIEARFYSEQRTFKHFVIGHKEASKVWNMLHGKIGPIRVLGHEVLELTDADQLFKAFFKSGDIIPSYNKRNITKQFLSK